ncbi:MAG TPA: hypothetical protein VF029_02730 [Actinomycetota bacterium]
MSVPHDDLAEGRARRSRAFVTIGAMVGLVALLPLAYAWLSDGREGSTTVAPSARPASPSADDAWSPPVADLHGRLVFTTFETAGSPGGEQQIWVLDLSTGALSQGPLVPTAEELWVADPARRWLVLVTAPMRAEGTAYLLTGLTPGAEPVELASGDLLSLSADGSGLFVGRSERTGRTGPACERHRYTLSRVAVESGARVTLAEGRLPCGHVVSGTVLGNAPMISVVHRGRPEVRLLRPRDPAVLFRGLAHLSSSPRGTVLLVEPERGVLRGLGVWPRTPTGPALVWPGAGAPRPLLSGERLYAQRVVAWSPDGGRVVVGGIVGDERGLWLVYVPAGTFEPLLPPNSFPLRSAFSGAAFDDRGRAFGGAPGTLVVATEEGVVPIPLPPDAPSPVGPVAWLP